jgi:hypothetical protein
MRQSLFQRKILSLYSFNNRVALTVDANLRTLCIASNYCKIKVLIQRRWFLVLSLVEVTDMFGYFDHAKTQIPSLYVKRNEYLPVLQGLLQGV